MRAVQRPATVSHITSRNISMIAHAAIHIPVSFFLRLRDISIIFNHLIENNSGIMIVQIPENYR